MRTFTSIIERFALLGMLILAFAFFALAPATSEYFLGVSNLQVLLAQLSLPVLVAVATTIPLIAGQIDISVGPSTGLAAMVTAGMMSRQGAPLWIAILAALIVGCLVGYINSLLIARVGISSIVATLGMTSVIAAVQYLYCGGQSIVTNIDEGLTNFGTGKILGIPGPVIVVVIVCIIAWYILGHTPAGRNLYAVGAAPAAAALVGLNVRRYVGLSLIAAGVVVSIAAVLQVSMNNGGQPTVGPLYIFPAVAAAFLGGTAYQRGRYNILGTVTAVAFIQIVINGLSLWGFGSWVTDMVSGISLIVAVGLSAVAGRRRSRSAAVEAVQGQSPASGGDGQELAPLAGAGERS